MSHINTKPLYCCIVYVGTHCKTIHYPTCHEDLFTCSTFFGEGGRACMEGSEMCVDLNDSIALKQTGQRHWGQARACSAKASINLLTWSAPRIRQHNTLQHDKTMRTVFNLVRRETGESSKQGCCCYDNTLVMLLQQYYPLPCFYILYIPYTIHPSGCYIVHVCCKDNVCIQEWAM